MALTRRVGAAGRLELRPDRPAGLRRRVNPVRLHQTPAIVYLHVVEPRRSRPQSPPPDDGDATLIDGIEFPTVGLS